MAAHTQQTDFAQIGSPDTVSSIVDEIRAAGPIPFARFMELALYHPASGYYMRTRDANGNQLTASNSDAEHLIGWSGDYYTAPDAHPIFSQALARQVDQIDTGMGHPVSFTSVEMGPGKGLLARDLLATCERQFPNLFARLHCILIERSPTMREAQRQHLAPWVASGHVSWQDDLRTLSANSVTGVFLSNELVDALPVHRIKIVNGTPVELYVAWRDDCFVEQVGPLSTLALSDYVNQLAAMDVALPEGYVTEINLNALAWMRDVARALGHGVAITIDYGHTAQDLYGPDRARGTLLCYAKHQASKNPYVRVGQQDITAHVDFTALAAAGEEAGLHVTGFTNQMSFLMGLGAEDLFASLAPDSAELRAAIRLLRPDGMGRTFKILIQHKGITAPALDGLRHKPFFGSVLAGAGQNVNRPPSGGKQKESGKSNDE
ncbi:MAG: class I SAM-dependent methyltransferase [Nitrospira sp.]|nr:class I SAM-dependent methyltransferase [Nitrospira sp.]